jgi:6,7-dimethyl-8-ribityllumazine synthase
MSDKIRILIVEARFYSDLADELLKGAADAIESLGAEYDVVTVPGALEIPAAIAFAEEAAHRPAGGAAYDGYVALGTVIRGETYHFEIVSNESARGLMELSAGRKQAWARARASQGDKGGGAARAALTMVALRQQFLGVRR